MLKNRLFKITLRFLAMLIFSISISGCMGANRNTKIEIPNSKSPVKIIQPQQIINHDKKKIISGQEEIANKSDKHPKAVKTSKKSKIQNLDKNNVDVVKAPNDRNRLVFGPENEIPKIGKLSLKSFKNKDGKIFSGENQPTGLAFNFDDADLYEVIRAMADILNLNYIVDPNVRGKVTIHTTGEFQQSDLYTLFYQILEANGLSAIQEGKLLKIVPKTDITKIPARVVYGREYQKIPINERLITQIIPLKNISVNSMKPILIPFLSEQGILLEQQESNILIIIDKNDNLKRLLKLVDTFDVDVFFHTKHKFFKFDHIIASDGMPLIESFIEPYLKIESSECKMILIEKMNAIVAITRNDRILDKIGYFINEIDITDNSNDSRIFIYHAKNGMATDLAGLLNSLFQEETITPQNSTQKSQKNTDSKGSNDFLPFGIKKDNKQGDKKADKNSVQKKAANTNQQLNKSGLGGSKSLAGEIRIISDDVHNALIIEALPSDYRVIEKILHELDVMPRQVLIDVMVAEITLTDEFEFGVEWTFTKGNNLSSGISTLTAGVAGLGVSAMFAQEWKAALSALANDGKVNVLSSPSVLASDNKSASINVAKQIPVITSTYETGDGVITTAVQYRNTGITLSVTPHIFDDGMVNMEISQQVSDTASSSAEGNPIFLDKTVATTVTVQDNQTIVIGGLISENISDSAVGVPFLASIPIVGFLFGKKKDSIIKTELVIMITPHVIKTVDDIDLISKDFKNKVQLIDSKKVLNLFSD